MWKEHFKNLLWKSPKITDNHITKMINNQLNVKLGQFSQEGLDELLTKIYSKAAGLDEIPTSL